jgi:alpha-D-ribose 1-methylphosphonate 5-triphosphate synthase subunit PhnG
MPLTEADRPRLIAALARMDADRLAAAANRFTERYPVRVTSRPTNGLAMMQIRESVNGDAFNLGEIPLSTATVELDLGNGQKVEGGAHVMADDADLAIWLAICDAALRHNLPGAEEIQALSEAGFASLQRDQDIRSSILDRTKVRFSLLNETESA